MKLLIVEDDEDTSSFVRYVMEEESHSALVASSVAAARDILKDYKPDLIILDRGLPDVDGLDFCRELRGDQRFARVPVLFLSAQKTPADVADGLEAGADDYVTKPFAFVELVARVQALLRKGPASAHG